MPPDNQATPINLDLITMPTRVGLLTLPLHTNYGGMLQAAALYRILTVDLKLEVVFLERAAAVAEKSLLRRAMIGTVLRLPFLFPLRFQLAQASQGKGALTRLASPTLAKKIFTRIDRGIRIRRSKEHVPFVRQALPQRSGILTSTQHMTETIGRLKIDALVVGSDQVWRLGYHPPGAEQDFFFGFAPSPSVRKVAYAASFGHDTWTYPQHTARTKELLASFDAVSVRESSGVSICRDVFGRQDVHHTIDPTLVVDRAFYDEIAAPRQPKSGSTFLSYVLDDGPDRLLIGEEIHKTLGTKFFHRALKLDIGWTTMNVPGWLREFMDADFVLTDSFHGVVFSIIFQKNFIGIINHNRGSDRFTSLLSQLGLEHRLVSDTEHGKVQDLVAQPIDYALVNSKLNELRKKSIQFLQNALS
jgi:hypothetical protein